MIVLSEGYSNYVPPQLRDIDALGGGFLNPLRYDPLAGESRVEQTQQFFETSYMRSELVYTADIANKNNTSFYMVDPRGLAVGEFDSSQVTIDMRTDYRMLRELQDTLHVLADETDGRAIVNRNDLLPGLSQIVSDQSAYYLLGVHNDGGADRRRVPRDRGGGPAGRRSRPGPEGVLRAERGERGAGARPAQA